MCDLRVLDGLPNLKCDSQRVFGFLVTCSFGSEAVAVSCIGLVQPCLPVTQHSRMWKKRRRRCEGWSMGGMLSDSSLHNTAAALVST